MPRKCQAHWCFKKYFLKMDGWMNGQLDGWPNILIKNEKLQNE